MQAHPNAHILQRLADIAQTTDKPWEHFEYRNGDSWRQCYRDFPFANPVVEIRERILNPVTINDKTLEGAMTEAPPFNTEYWTLFREGGTRWRDEEYDFEMLRAGRAFRTREAREAMQTEVTNLLKGASDEQRH